jgi:peptidoglycan/LPS O-acetylase OafA/YrhL
VPLTDAREHVPALDGLRGIAIAMVMAFHFTLFERMQGKLPDAEFGAVGVGIRQLMLTGWAGVDVFFVLSGFLITGILLRAKGKDGYFRVFYWRRFLRIFPAYYVFLALISWILATFFPRSLSRADLRHGFWLWTYASNVLIALRGWNSIPLPLAHFWSLAVEEQFYLVWPLLIFALSRRAAFRVCAALLVLAPAIRAALVWTGHPIAAVVLTFARMDSLAAGALLALAMDGAPIRAPVLKVVAALSLVSAGVLASIFVVRRGQLVESDVLVATIGYTALAVLSIGLVAIGTLAPDKSAVARWMANPALRFLGRYSYGLYIVHEPIVFILWVSGVMKAGLGIADAWMPKLASAVLVNLLLPTVVSIAVAWVSWHLMEQRFLRLKDRVTYGQPARMGVAPQDAI